MGVLVPRMGVVIQGDGGASGPIMAQLANPGESVLDGHDTVLVVGRSSWQCVSRLGRGGIDVHQCNELSRLTIVNRVVELAHPPMREATGPGVGGAAWRKS